MLDIDGAQRDPRIPVPVVVVVVQVGLDHVPLQTNEEVAGVLELALGLALFFHQVDVGRGLDVAQRFGRLLATGAGLGGWGW